MKIRTLIVDDHTFIRQALKISLAEWNYLEIVGEAESGSRAISLVEQLQPDVVLMDIQMPGMDGVEVTKIICDRFSRAKVLILTIDDNDEYVFQALKYGASGYILKNTSPEELSFAIQAVYRGYMHLDLNLGRRLILSIPDMSGSSEWEKLTPREQEIVRYVATGASNEEIAIYLNISIKTVKNHITNILSQLNLRNRTEIVVYLYFKKWLQV